MKTDHILYISAALFLGCIAIAGGSSLLVFVGACGYCFYLYHKKQTLINREWEADIKYREREAAFVAVPTRSGVLSYNQGTVQFWTKHERTAPNGKEITGPDVPGKEPQANLFDILRTKDRILVIGGMGSGKSELLKWLSADRSQSGDLIILDSHAAPDTWPVGEVIGLGRDYPAIERAVRTVCAEQDRRYQKRASGTQKKFPQICLVIDEMSILNMFADLSGEFKSLLCECRKVNIKLIIGGQSDRAGSMGLKGNYDLMAGFDAFCQLDVDENGHHYGTVKVGKSEKVYPHPGIFRHVTSHRHTAENSRKPTGNGFTADHDTMTYLTSETGETHAVIDTEPLTRHIFESRQEKEIVTMYEAGESLNNIVRKVMGKESNGRLTGQIKAVLENYGYRFN